MPTEISDWNDLDNVRNDLTGDYVLVNDLDKDTSGYAGIGDDFEPIGFVNDEVFTSEFNGSFDGNGHSINDVKIEEDDEDVGFFASTDNNALIENLILRGSVINNSNGRLTAGLVGLMNGGTVQNCAVFMDVNSNGDRVGLLTGTTQFGTVKNCLVGGSVVGENIVGGLVGRHQTTIEDTYCIADVTGTDQVGGFIGFSRNADKVKTCYSVGDVTGETNVAGFIGDIEPDFEDENEIESCYWDVENSGTTTGINNSEETQDLEGLTTDEMQGSEAETNMDGFDFDTVWESVE